MIKKNCSYCKKNKNIRFFRKNRGECQKCEYLRRKDYLKKYRMAHPYKDLTNEKKEKLRSQRKAYYRRNHPIKIKKKDMIKLQEDKKKLENVKEYTKFKNSKITKIILYI